jgi:hypothetical protein
VAELGASVRGTIRGSLFTAVRFSAIHAMTLATSDSVLISSASKKWTAKRNAQLALTFSVARSPIARAIASSTAGDTFMITVGLVEAAFFINIA